MSAVATSASLTASIVNPILLATIETFDMMLSCKVSRKSLAIKTPETAFYGITAVIGLTGTAAGTICVSFPQETAFACVRRLLDMEFTEVNALVCDSVGEFANMIAGSAKDKLSQAALNLGIPTVVRGEKHHVDFPSNSQPMCVTYESELGPFMIAFGFVNRC